MAPRLTPGSIKCAHDLRQKLERDAALLDEEVSSDRLFNFAVIGYSLINWVEHDPASSSAVRDSREIDSLNQEVWLRICGDVATGAKHFEITRRTPLTAEVTSTKGFGLGRFGKGPFGLGEEQIQLKLLDGTVHDVQDLVGGVLDTWTAFFARLKV